MRGECSATFVSFCSLVGTHPEKRHSVALIPKFQTSVLDTELMYTMPDLPKTLLSTILD